MTGQSVCAVVVTYKPDKTFVDNIIAIEGQVGQVLVVDNNSSDGTERLLRKLEADRGWSVILNDDNLGIAAALNLGVNYAMRAGFDWVATFDQDSLASDGYILNMLETYRKCPTREQVAIVAPLYVDRESGVQGRSMRTGSAEILATMTSGSMIPLRAIEELGGFDESLFMDYVDIEFSLRARRKGMGILESQAILYHALGRETYHRFCGVSFRSTNHSAARRYYITRNRVRLLARYIRDWPWMWRESKAFLSETIKIAMVEDRKWDKLGAIAAGVRDALLGKVGKRAKL